MPEERSCRRRMNRMCSGSPTTTGLSWSYDLDRLERFGLGRQVRLRQRELVEVQDERDEIRHLIALQAARVVRRHRRANPLEERADVLVLPVRHEVRAGE